MRGKSTTVDDDDTADEKFFFHPALTLLLLVAVGRARRCSDGSCRSNMVIRVVEFLS
jgi:hypothetical protein